MGINTAAIRIQEEIMVTGTASQYEILEIIGVILKVLARGYTGDVLDKMLV